MTKADVSHGTGIGTEGIGPGTVDVKSPALARSQARGRRSVAGIRPSFLAKFFFTLFQAPPDGTTNIAFSLALGVPLVQNDLTQALAARPVHPKKARTVFVGGLTPALTADVLREFFDTELPKIPGRPKTPGARTPWT